MTFAAVVTRFSLVILIWVALHAYVAVRLIRPIRGWNRLLALAFVVVVAALPPITMWADRTGVAIPMKDAVRWIGFASVGFSAFLSSWFVAEDVVRMAARGASKLRRGAPEGAAPDPGRRMFLRNSVNLGAVAAAGGLTTVEARAAQNPPRIREVPIPVRGLPADLEGFRIVQISDLHVGGTIRRDYVERVARAAQALAPDLIAVTGDLVDGSVAEWREEVSPLGELHAPHGVFFVTGNHEYYWDPLGWIDVLRSYGWDALINEHRVIRRGAGSILLAGVTDYRSARYVAAHVHDPAQARAGAPACDVSILLAHQPRSIFEAARARYDVQISGHTHGGQFFPVNLLVHLIEPYTSGLHRHDGTWIYVNSGAGYWGPPLRFGVPKEIAVIRLTRDA